MARINGRTSQDEETTALIGKPRQGHALTHRIRRHFAAKIDRKWADVILLLLYIPTGLLDTSAIYIYGCFVSMQTGNTIYLGLGLIHPQASNRWIRSIISIVAFCFGSFFFSRLHRLLVPTRRWTLMLSYALQTLLATGAALAVTFGPEVDEDGPITAWVIVPLCLLAIQSAGQATTSRALHYNGVTSVVLTSSYTDLFSDPNLFSLNIKDNPERNRRLIAPFLLLVGAVLGGVFAHTTVELDGALWVAVGVKAIIVVTWAFWKEAPVEDEEQQQEEG